MPSDFGDVLATLATTSGAMGKWMLRLDLAGHKGPETILEGILIGVEGCFAVERTCRSGFNFPAYSLSLMKPTVLTWVSDSYPLSLLLLVHTPDSPDIHSIK